MTLAVLLVACSLATAQTALGDAAPKIPQSQVVPPPSYRLSAHEAVAIADRQVKVQLERRKRRGLKAVAYTKGRDRWQVSYSEGVHERAQVLIDDRSERAVEVWTGPQVAWMMARGYPGAFAGPADGLLIWIPLCLLFVAPFFDVRRPFRMLHLDLLALLGFSLSFAFFNHGNVSASVPLVYPVLGYLLVRLLFAGARPRKRAEPLIPHMPLTWILLAVVFLGCFRVALNVSDSNVIDVGYAGVIGADRIVHGRPVYGHSFPHGITRGDTYGPVTYLSYVPFVLAFGWSGRSDSPPAAHAAAIAFDLLTMLGLFLLGRRVRAGPSGVELGVALSFAWASYPFTLFILNSNSNDSLVALLLVASLLAVTSRPGRGVMLGLAAAAKFAPIALWPLFASASSADRGPGSTRLARTLRASAVPSLALVVVVLLIFLPFVPHGGLRALYDRTIGFQTGRDSPFSIWGQHHSLGWLLTLAKAAVGALALGLAFYPPRKGALECAALGAATLIAIQICMGHWFYLYIVWFAPLAFVAMLGAYRTGARALASEAVAGQTAAQGPG